MNKQRQSHNHKPSLPRLLTLAAVILLLASFGRSGSSLGTRNPRFASIASLMQGEETEEVSSAVEEMEDLETEAVTQEVAELETETEEPELAVAEQEETKEVFTEEPTEETTESLPEVEETELLPDTEAESETETITEPVTQPEPEPPVISLDVIDGNKTLACKAGKRVNPLELVKAKAEPAGKVKVKASISEIYLGRPHTQRVTYEVSAVSEAGAKSSEKFVVDFKIVDEECPKIDFGHKKISIQEGDSFDPLKNINYVRDAVEGDAEYRRNEPSGKVSGTWYTVDSRVNPDVPGVYKVYVHASDSSGNVKDREYQVTVKEKTRSCRGGYGYGLCIEYKYR